MSVSKSPVKGSRALAVFRNKWSARAEYFRLFLVCSFPVHVWAYINLLNDLPAMQLQMGIWRMLGVAAYVLTFALLESMFIFGLIYITSFILPETLFGVQFLQVASIFILTASIPVIFIHLYDQRKISSFTFPGWVALWVLTGLSIFILGVYWLNRSPRFQARVQSAVGGLVVLSFVYLSLDILGLLVILIRNVFAPI